MPLKATVYKILIASPSDVVEERKAIPDVIHNWNAVNSKRYRVILEPVLWEKHSYPVLGDRPQAIINKQIVEDSDILIGAFWTRIGTNTGRAESGTVEEIEEFLNAGKPVLLYFSSRKVSLPDVDIEQYEILKEFIAKCKTQGLVCEYSTIDILREQLQRHITQTIDELQQTNEGSTGNEPYIPTSEHQVDPGIIKVLFKRILKGFEVEWNAEVQSRPHDIEVGEMIIEKAFGQIMEFRKTFVQEEDTQLTALVDELIQKFKNIKRINLKTINGGVSFRAFWAEGNSIILLLKTILKELEDR